MGVNHPTQSNYLAFFSGASYALPNDCSHRFHRPSLA